LGFTGGGGTRPFVIGGSNAANIAFGTDIFLTIVGGSAGSASETQRQMSCPFGFSITQIQIHARPNTFDVDGDFNFRDDTITVATLVITAGVPALYTASVSNVSVAANSLINFNVDLSASAAGGTTPRGFTMCGRA